MHCPHCGAKNEEGNRFCVDCGSELPRPAGASAGRPPGRERIMRLIGTTGRARLLSAGTIAALAVAVVAFLALKPSESSVTDDAYTRSTDEACVTEKRTIAALERETIQQQPPNLAAFSGALVLIVEEWRSTLRESPAPPRHAAAVEALDQALLDVLIRAGALARVVRDGSPAQVAAAAQRVDLASTRVDGAIDDLGLAGCSDLAVAPVGLDSP